MGKTVQGETGLERRVSCLAGAGCMCVGVAGLKREGEQQSQSLDLDVSLQAGLDSITSGTPWKWVDVT